MDEQTEPPDVARPPVVPYPSTPPLRLDQLPSSGAGAAATIGSRAVARILDQVLISLPLVMLTQPYVRQVGTGANAELIDERPVWLLALTLVVPVVYEIAFITLTGRTVAKMLLRLRVVRHRDGRLPSPTQSVARYLVPAIPGLLVLLIPDPSVAVVVGLATPLIYLSAIVDPVRRGLHDKAAATIVLRTA